ncbi:MAG TPA: cold shock domain-containing protein [Streptosporangiaceae bacterium]
MATGKVLQFDPSRGYGFVASDDGGDDIFLHASVFDGDPYELILGTALEFQIMASERGRKAFAVHLAGNGTGPHEQPVLPSQLIAAGDEEQMCDVLSQAEFTGELTELLLNTIPALTGPQILEVRQGMLEFARTRGWVDA